MTRIQILFCAAFLIGIHGEAGVCQSSSASDEYGMAVGHYERQEYQSAAEKFREVIKMNPSTRQAAVSYFYLGESLVQLHDYASAFPTYKIFLARLPDDELSIRAEFRLAECAFRLNWEQQAVELLESFISKHPEEGLNEYALAYLGEARLQRNEPQIALNVFNRGLTEFPDSRNRLRYRFGIARALQAMQRFEEAQKFYDLITSDPTSPFAGQAKLQLGIIEYERANFENAKELFLVAQQWMKSDERHPESVYWLAKTNMALENYEIAYREYNQAIEQIVDQDLKAAVLFDGAMAAVKVGKSKTALTWLNRLRKTWPESNWADDALQLQIETLFQQKLFDRALEGIVQFESEFLNHDNLPLIIEYRGRICYERRQHSSTVNIFKTLIEEHGDKPSMAERVGTWKYFKSLGLIGLKKYAAAATSLENLGVNESDANFRSAILLAQATCAIGLDLPGKAIEYLENYLANQTTSKSADRAWSDLILAYAQTHQWGKVEQAVQQFEVNHTEQSVLLETQLIVAELALKERRLELAEKSFRFLADTSNPRKFVVQGLSGLAWVRMANGEEVSSIEIFEQLVAEFAETPFAAEAALVCGKYFEQQRSFSKAIQMYNHVQSKFEKSEFALLARIRVAVCLAESGLASDVVKAESMLLSYLNEDDRYIDEAQYQLAWIYLDSDRKSAAYELFEEIIKREESPYWADSAYRLAKSHVDNKKYDLARDIVINLKRRELPQMIKSRTEFLAGQIALHDKNWKQVGQYMQSVLEDSDDEEMRRKSRYWLAESLFHDKQYQAAEKEFDKLISSQGLITENRKAWALLRRVQCLCQLEQWAAAFENAVEGKKKYPEFEALYEFDFAIGRVHAAQGRLTEARESFQKVVKSATGSTTETAAMAQWRIGETYFHQERYERAIESFYRVDSLYGYGKWRAAALVEAGKCQEQLGNWNHAVKLYQQVLDKYPGSEFQLAAEQRINLASRQAKRLPTHEKK